MPILTCYVDDRTMAILEREAAVRGRSPTDLAEAAIEDAAIRCLPPPCRQPGLPMSGFSANTNPKGE